MKFKVVYPPVCGIYIVFSFSVHIIKLHSQYVC